MLNPLGSIGEPVQINATCKPVSISSVKPDYFSFGVNLDNATLTLYLMKNFWVSTLPVGSWYSFKSSMGRFSNHEASDGQKLLGQSMCRG